MNRNEHLVSFFVWCFSSFCPNSLQKSATGSGIRVLCRCCDTSFSVCSAQPSQPVGLRGFRPGVSGQSAGLPPTPRSPPRTARQLTLRRPRQPTSLLPPPNAPCSGSAALLLRAAEGRRAAPAGWSSVSNRPSAPSLPPACSHTDAAPASGTQRLNTPAAQRTGGGNEEVSSDLGDVKRGGNRA